MGNPTAGAMGSQSNPEKLSHLSLPSNPFWILSPLLIRKHISVARNRSKPSIWQAGSPPVGKAPRHKPQGMLQKALSPSSHPLLQAGRNTGSSRSFISLFDFPCSGSQSLKSMDGSLKERENKPSHCLNSFTVRFPRGKHD